MIELTPLDVRKKRGDFRRAMRGFDPAEVDSFIELVAERMESLVKENLTLKERAARLQDQVREQGHREKAVQDALVTAQELRKDISGQAQREAELMKREAEAEIERMLLDAEFRAEELRSSAADLERRRLRFLRSYRQHLERELEDVNREAAQHPLGEKPLELELSHTAVAEARTNGRVSAVATVPVQVAELDEAREAEPAEPAPVAIDVDGQVEPLQSIGSETSYDSSHRSSDDVSHDSHQSAGEGATSPAVAIDEPEAATELDSELGQATPSEPTTTGGSEEAVAVESLAPELDESSTEDAETWDVVPRMRTEVGSDRSGDPDGL